MSDESIKLIALSQLKTFKEECDDLYATKEDIPTVPSKVSELTNDKGYLTKATADNTYLAQDNADDFVMKSGLADEVQSILESYNLDSIGTPSIYYDWQNSGQTTGIKFDINAPYTLIFIVDLEISLYGILERTVVSASDGSETVTYLFSYLGKNSLTDQYSDYLSIVKNEDGSDTILLQQNYSNKVITMPLQEFSLCLREDTLIPLEDGSYKAIKDIAPKDKVGFYNTFNHDPRLQYNLVCVPTLSSIPKTYRSFVFSNGETLNIGGNHMLYNVERDSILGSDEWEIGMHGIGYFGESIELLSIQEHINTEGYKFYNIFTRHYRYLANNILCGHSAAALYQEFMKFSNKKYRFKNSTYMEYLHRKYIEKEMLKGFVPLGIGNEILTIKKEYSKFDDIENQNLQYLSDTDYKVIKYQSNLISLEEYEESEQLREAARVKIRDARQKKFERDEQINKIKIEYLNAISPYSSEP